MNSPWGEVHTVAIQSQRRIWPLQSFRNPLNPFLAAADGARRNGGLIMSHRAKRYTLLVSMSFLLAGLWHCPASREGRVS
jgi:hypothetical protein